MSKLIESYYMDENIQRLSLYTDINTWKSEITHIDLENHFYKRFYSSLLLEKPAINKRHINFPLEELETLDALNQDFSVKLGVFINELEGVKECDDLHCEPYYLNNYQKFKIAIENYFCLNRNLKTRVYFYTTDGIKKYR